MSSLGLERGRDAASIFTGPSSATTAVVDAPASPLASVIANGAPPSRDVPGFGGDAVPRLLGYVRHADETERARQRAELSSYACSISQPLAAVFEDVATMPAPGLDALRRELRAGDAVAVVDLARLTRSMDSLMRLADEWRKMRVGLLTTTHGPIEEHHVMARVLVADPSPANLHRFRQAAYARFSAKGRKTFGHRVSATAAARVRSGRARAALERQRAAANVAMTAIFGSSAKKPRRPSRKRP